MPGKKKLSAAAKKARREKRKKAAKAKKEKAAERQRMRDEQDPPEQGPVYDPGIYAVFPPAKFVLEPVCSKCAKTEGGFPVCAFAVTSYQSLRIVMQENSTRVDGRVHTQPAITSIGAASFLTGVIDGCDKDCVNLAILVGLRKHAEIVFQAALHAGYPLDAPVEE